MYVSEFAAGVFVTLFVIFGGIVAIAVYQTWRGKK